MITYEPSVGEDIHVVVGAMIGRAILCDQSVTTDFNGTLIEAAPDSEIRQVVAFYHQSLRAGSSSLSASE